MDLGAVVGHGAGRCEEGEEGGRIRDLPGMGEAFWEGLEVGCHFVGCEWLPHTLLSSVFMRSIFMSSASQNSRDQGQEDGYKAYYTG